VALVALGLVAASGGIVGSAPAGAAAGTVNIRVTMNILGVKGPVVFERDHVTPGPGVELDGTDVVSNPTPLPGTVTVDINPTSHTITVAPEDWHGAFSTAQVTITGGLYEHLTVVKDELWDTHQQGAEMHLLSATASPAAGVNINWSTNSTNAVGLNGVHLTSVFHYLLAAAPTTTTVPPTTSTTAKQPASPVAGQPSFTG
jgi:hypothetical protein